MYHVNVYAYFLKKTSHQQFNQITWLFKVLKAWRNYKKPNLKPQA